jgi:hypothetical protein
MESSSEISNIKAEMKLLCEEIGLRDMAKSAITVASEVHTAMEEKYRGMPIQSHSTEYMKSLVHRTRNDEHGDWTGLIFKHPLSSASETDTRSFLQFYLQVLVDDVMTKIIGWGHPDLIHLMKYGPVYTFIDCTFNCCPKGFYQCMIIMVYDPSTNMYVPVFFVLLQTKKQLAYWHAISQCIATCDFERGLINAVQDHFPDNPLVGCEFHWKQAIRRKLLDLRIPKDIISRLVDPEGLLNILTVIPINEIECKGIPYIRAHFDEGGHTDKFDVFWNYFANQWMNMCDPNCWNINGIIDGETAEGRMINRTNNPLERFNRRLNTAFPTPDPTMMHFISAIQRISNEYVITLHRTKMGKTARTIHRPVTVHSIPTDYTSSEIHVSGIKKSKYTLIDEYRHLIGKTHYDPDDDRSYITLSIQMNSNRALVAYRELCRYQHDGKQIVGDLDRHCISVTEAHEYTYSGKENSAPNR